MWELNRTATLCFTNTAIPDDAVRCHPPRDFISAACKATPPRVHCMAKMLGDKLFSSTRPLVMKRAQEVQYGGNSSPTGVSLIPLASLPPGLGGTSNNQHRESTKRRRIPPQPKQFLLRLCVILGVDIRTSFSFETTDPTSFVSCSTTVSVSAGLGLTLHQHVQRRSTTWMIVSSTHNATATWDTRPGIVRQGISQISPEDRRHPCERTKAPRNESSA